MAKHAPNELTATQIIREIEARRLTSEEVVRACLDRIADREADVGAWTHVDVERAIAAAQAFDRAGRGGPLCGIPFGVKDIIDYCANSFFIRSVIGSSLAAFRRR